MRSAALRRALFRAASCVVVAGWAALRAFWAPSKTVRAALVSVLNAVAWAAGRPIATALAAHARLCCGLWDSKNGNCSTFLAGITLVAKATMFT